MRIALPSNTVPLNRVSTDGLCAPGAAAAGAGLLVALTVGAAEEDFESSDPPPHAISTRESKRENEEIRMKRRVNTAHLHSETPATIILNSYLCQVLGILLTFRGRDYISMRKFYACNPMALHLMHEYLFSTDNSSFADFGHLT